MKKNFTTAFILWVMPSTFQLEFQARSLCFIFWYFNYFSFFSYTLLHRAQRQQLLTISLAALRSWTLSVLSSNPTELNLASVAILASRSLHWNVSVQLEMRWERSLSLSHACSTSTFHCALTGRYSNTISCGSTSSCRFSWNWALSWFGRVNARQLPIFYFLVSLTVVIYK